MSQKTILYFTAGDSPTEAEQTAITALEAQAASQYVVKVLNGRPRAKISATTISAAAVDNSYNDSGNGFLTAGFAVGMHVGVRGFTGDTANNINDGVITALTAAKMTIGGTDGNVIAVDAAGETVVIESLEDTASFGNGIIAGDYSAGTVPIRYYNAGALRYPAYTYTAPPEAPNLPAGQHTVTNGDTLTVGGATVTLSVADHTMTGALAATKAVVSTTQEIPITSGTGTTKVTLTIAGGAITACVLS